MPRPPRSEANHNLTPNSVRAVGVRSTVDHVAREIERALTAGDLAAGEEFSTAELSAQLDVSPIPVREALRRFEAQGLVTLRPGRRAIVTPIDPEQLAAVCRLWILISSDVLERACSAYTEEDFLGMEESLDEFTSYEQDSEEAFRAHHEFHLRMLRPGATEWDMRLLAILWVPIERAVRLTFGGIVELTRSEAPQKLAYDEHHALVEAARSRDWSQLQEAMREHHQGRINVLSEELELLELGKRESAAEGSAPS
jgi:DNA-binding GntR family transcriptional regulator